MAHSNHTRVAAALADLRFKGECELFPAVMMPGSWTPRSITRMYYFSFLDVSLLGMRDFCLSDTVI